ncbi:MAG: hypothetical protein JSV87_00265 [Candidatus Bathyarchaeota archaeon]|nr:MAG: hypothetical protein JSW29_07365 [Candidatus Bathyarchaeota archaeon]UCD40021.1 MAG: hypothetical protein JSV87_00265 [Candidatus Bathyarchaeota archaeon]
MREYKLRFAVALAGLIVFMGVIMVGVFAMVFFGFVDVSTLETKGYRMLSLWALLAIGVLDLVSGIMLRRR